VADNGFSGQVTIVHGKCEEVTLPVDKVRRGVMRGWVVGVGVARGNAVSSGGCV